MKKKLLASAENFFFKITKFCVFFLILSFVIVIVIVSIFHYQFVFVFVSLAKNACVNEGLSLIVIVNYPTLKITALRVTDVATIEGKNIQ